MASETRDPVIAAAAIDAAPGQTLMGIHFDVVDGALRYHYVAPNTVQADHEVGRSLIKFLIWSGAKEDVPKFAALVEYVARQNTRRPLEALA